MPATHRSRALPETSAPRVAAWSALIAVAALIATTGIAIAFDSNAEQTRSDIAEAARLVFLAIFAISGLAALGASIRSLMIGERSAAVWAALAIGGFTALLLIGELTILE